MSVLRDFFRTQRPDIWARQAELWELLQALDRYHSLVRSLIIEPSDWTPDQADGWIMERIWGDANDAP